MKLIIGIVLLMALALIFYTHFSNSNDSVAAESFSSQRAVSSSSSNTQASTQTVSNDLKSLASEAVSSAVASVKSLSGARVDLLPEIAHFLRQMDNASIPKIYLPKPKRFAFDYGKAKPSELKDKALSGDPYAAYRYADYIVERDVRKYTDRGDYAYEMDHKKRDLAMSEAREFYIRGFRGGISSIAQVLSRLYADQAHGGNRAESLAWRRISFAVGESQRYECLRNSTTCFVKDFNNLNRPELFYPCLSAAGDSCTQEEYDTGMQLAFQYADSLEFAMNNKVIH